MAKKPAKPRTPRKRNAPADEAPSMHQERMDKGWRFDPDDAEKADLELETLSGDMRDTLMAQITDMKVGWSFLTESEQRSRLIRVEATCKSVIRRTMRLMLEDYEFPHMRVAVGEWKVKKPKDGPIIEVRLSLPLSEPDGVKLLHHQGSEATLVLADHRVFEGERKPFEVKPDQGDIFGGDDEDGDGDEDDPKDGSPKPPPPQPQPAPAPPPGA